MGEPYNGKVTCTDDNNIGSACSFTCDEGFTLFPEGAIFCELSADSNAGKWSADTPTCTGKYNRLYLHYISHHLAA